MQQGKAPWRKLLQDIFLRNWGTGWKWEVRRTPRKERLGNRNSKSLWKQTARRNWRQLPVPERNNLHTQMWTVSLCRKDSKCTKRPTWLNHEFFILLKQQRNTENRSNYQGRNKKYSISIKVQKSERPRHTKNKNKKGDSELRPSKHSTYTFNYISNNTSIKKIISPLIIHKKVMNRSNTLMPFLHQLPPPRSVVIRWQHNGIVKGVSNQPRIRKNRLENTLNCVLSNCLNLRNLGLGYLNHLVK